MGSLVILGFLVACSLVALIFRIGVRTVFGYGALADIAAMVVLALLFHGTFAGMSVAILAGLFFSAAIWLIRRQLGYRTWDWRRWQWDEVPPDPIPLPTVQPTNLLRLVGVFTVTVTGLLLALFGLANAYIGPAGTIVMAPGIIAAAAILAALITWRLA